MLHPTTTTTTTTASQEKSKLYLIMEYCAGGDLAHYLRAQKRVPEATAQHFMQQLAAGLREMWAHHLVHVSRDGGQGSGERGGAAQASRRLQARVAQVRRAA